MHSISSSHNQAWFNLHPTSHCSLDRWCTPTEIMRRRLNRNHSPRGKHGRHVFSFTQPIKKAYSCIRTHCLFFFFVFILYILRVVCEISSIYCKENVMISEGAIPGENNIVNHDSGREKNRRREKLCKIFHSQLVHWFHTSFISWQYNI